MIRTEKIEGLLAEHHLTKSDMANKLGITPKTFYLKMQKGVFGSDEIQVMIDVLNIKEPMDIFFAKE